MFSGLAWHTACARAWSDGETLACEPGLKDTADDVQGAGLDDTAPDRFTAPDADVDDALEGERETVGGLLVKRLWIETRGWFGGMGIWRGEAVDESRILWRGGRNAVIVKDVNEALEATVHGHDFSYSWGGGSQVSEMCERVEEWQGRVGVECWSMARNQRADMGQMWERLRGDIPRLSYS